MMYKYLIIVGVLFIGKGFVYASDGMDLNQGFQAFGKVIRHFIHSQGGDLKLGDGIHIINTLSPNDATGRATEDSSLFGMLENYLQSHELRIKLAELMPNRLDFGRALKDATENDVSDIGTGRGKNKGGGAGGALLVLGSLFASTLGAIGIGGAGLLAMKALTVAAMALLLAAVVGVKKLSSSHDDGGGHHVIHASGHGYEHRRKREATDLAYRAWKPYTSFALR